MPSMLIYAHRGSSGREPENTLRAFEAALADGADGVELDVHASADRVPVVIHDREVGRTTTGHGPVDTLTLAALRELDAGGGQRVPTFVEVLDLLAGRVRLDIELKQAGIGQEVLAALERYPAADWAISSFEWAILRDLRARAPRAALWPLAVAATDRLFAEARDLGSPVVALMSGALTEDIAARCAGADLGVVVWTVNDIGEARRVQQLGAIGLCTDLPAVIRPGLGEGSVPGSGSSRPSDAPLPRP